MVYVRKLAIGLVTIGSLLGIGGSAEGLEQIEVEIADGNSVGLTVINNGFFGNNLNSRGPSMEFPLGSTEEHLVGAGLWVGAITEEGDTLVSTAFREGYQGGGMTGNEFSPITRIEKYSGLPNSQYYDPAHAVSELDLLCSYADDSNYYDEHTPLGIRIDQSTHQFSFEPADAVVLVDFTITNTNADVALQDVYVGFNAELTSGWKDGHDRWPPGGSWFGRQDISYVDSLYLMTEHHFQDDDGNCTSHGGVTLLSIDSESTALLEPTVSFNWWNWDPAGHLPDTPSTDPKRYSMLSNGDLDPTAGSEAPNNDPIMLLSIGPLGHHTYTDDHGQTHLRLESGDSLRVLFGLLGGSPVPEADPPRTAAEDIVLNARWAHEVAGSGHVTIPPTLGLVQNPYLTQHLDIYFTSWGWARSAEPMLEVSGEHIEVTSLDTETGVWVGEYEIPTTADSLRITACIPMFSDFLNCEEELWTADYLSADGGGDARSADGSVRLAFAPYSLPYDAFILSRNLECEEGDYTFVVCPAGLPLHGSAELSVNVPPALVAELDAGKSIALSTDSGDLIATRFNAAQGVATANIDALGSFRLVVGDALPAPALTQGSLRVLPTTPCPARSQVTVCFELGTREETEINICDPAGRSVAALAIGMAGPGRVEIPWRFSEFSTLGVPSGLYYYTIRAGTQSKDGRILVVR